jgi:hypothetical protein
MQLLRLYYSLSVEADCQKFGEPKDKQRDAMLPKGWVLAEKVLKSTM